MQHCKFCEAPMLKNATTCRECGRTKTITTVPFAKEFPTQAHQDVTIFPPPDYIFQINTEPEFPRRYSLWDNDSKSDSGKLNQLFSQDIDQKDTLRFNTPTPLLLQNQRARKKVIALRGFNVFIVVLILFVALSGISGYVLGSLIPTISLVEATHGTIGDLLHMHGQNFLAGTKVVLTRDASVPLNVAVRETYEIEQTQNGTQAVGKKLATLSGNTLTLGSTGTFDVTLFITQNWSVGSHTIRASELSGLLSTEIMFTVFLPPTSGTQNTRVVESRHSL